METERVVKSLIKTAKDSIETKSYYSSLAILLMIPEIINGKNDEASYVNWCNKNIKDYDEFSGEVLYKLKKELFFGNKKCNSYCTPNIKIYETSRNMTRFCFDTKDRDKNWKTYTADIDSFLDNFISSIELYLLREAA